MPVTLQDGFKIFRLDNHCSLRFDSAFEFAIWLPYLRVCLDVGRAADEKKVPKMISLSQLRCFLSLFMPVTLQDGF